MMPAVSFLVGRAEALPVPTHSMDILSAAGSLNFAEWSFSRLNLKFRPFVMPCSRASARGCRRCLRPRERGGQNDLRRHRRRLAIHQSGAV